MSHENFPYQFKETLGRGVVVTLFIDQVLFAHLVHTEVHMGHKPAHTLTDISLYIVQCKSVTVTQKATVQSKKLQAYW